MTWNTPKPQEWKSEELSQGRIIDYKAFNFVDGEGVRNSLYVSGCMFHCRDAITLPPGPLRQNSYTKELEEQIMRI
ncbi:MAG: 4Fe-4S cluster-binding domain-containing protein [Streptococcus sp.]